MQNESAPNLRLVGIREALRLPSSVGLRAALLYLPTNFLGSFLFERAVRGGPVITWLKILAIEISILIFIYAWIHFFLKSFAIKQLHILLTLTLFLVIQVAGGVITAFLIRSYGIEDELHLAIKTLGGMPFVLSEMVLIAYLLANFDVHRRLTSSLQQAEANLRYMNANVSSLLAQDTQEILDRIHAEIDPQIEEIDARLATLGQQNDRDSTIETLKTYVSTTLKPMSRSLNKFLLEDQLAPTNVAIRPKVFDFSIRISLAETLHPIFWTIAISIMTLTASIATVPTNQLLRLTIQTFISIFIYLRFIQFLAQQYQLRFLGTLLFDLAVFGSLGPILLGLTEFANVPTSNYPQNFMNISFAVGLINGAMAALTTTFKSTHSVYMSRLSKTVEDLKSIHSQLRQNAWATRKRLGRILHGSLQSTLHAVAINLSSNNALSAQDIEEMRLRIKSSVDELESESQENIPLAVRFEELSGIWSGACTITWDISRGANNKLQQSEALSQCVWEIITEITSNANHHGNAKNIWFQLELKVSLLILTSSNDGQPWIQNNSAGLGIDLYNELSRHWSIDNQSDRTTLTFAFATD